MKRVIATLAVALALAFGVIACEPSNSGGSPGLESAPSLESPGMESPMETLEPVAS